MDVLKAQNESLDATDSYSSAWSVTLANAAAAAASSATNPRGDTQSVIKVPWGGRGQGGRGTSRRTFQPHDIVVESVNLEYVNDVSVTGVGSGGSKVLLRDAYLKLLPGRIYALIGRNGVGKSSFLKRIESCKIPGFPPHIKSLLVSQEVFGHESMSPLEIVLEHDKKMKDNHQDIAFLEDQIDGLDVDSEDYAEKMEEFCNLIAELESGNPDDEISSEQTNREARMALQFFGVPTAAFFSPTSQLSGGIRKKVALACALMSKPQLLLLDEPTCHIDIDGILQLRRLIDNCTKDSKTTIVLVSHDIDLLNDVATDVIHFHLESLEYYMGNYHDFLQFRKNRITHQLKQANALEKQRSSMIQSIDNLKKKSSQSGNQNTKKKISRAIESKKKKFERHGIEKNDDGHRRTAQMDGGIRKGSMLCIDASTRNNLTHKELLKRTEIDIGPVPDKAVHFDFRKVLSTWGDEPLVMVMDVGFKYELNNASNVDCTRVERDVLDDPKLIFDCVELCIREENRVTILGENSSGKSTLLSIIAGKMSPTEGTVHFANGINIGYFHQHSSDFLFSTIGYGTEGNGGGVLVTALTFLTNKFPHKTEQEIRGELTRFGLSPKQANTNVRFLSGGERCRLCMASMMLEDPQILVMDEISNHLDVESVEALIYGLNQWNGTIVLASHDANLIRRVGDPENCFVLFDGKLMRMEGGIDRYLKIFKKHFERSVEF